MVFGKFDIFFKIDKSVTNKAKIEELKQYDTGDLLTVLRNIEEAPRDYEEEIIKTVYTCLFDKGIMCI